MSYTQYESTDEEVEMIPYQVIYHTAQFPALEAEKRRYVERQVELLRKQFNHEILPNGDIVFYRSGPRGAYGAEKKNKDIAYMTVRR